MHGSPYGVASHDPGRRVFEQSGAIEPETCGGKRPLQRAEQTGGGNVLIVVALKIDGGSW